MSRRTAGSGFDTEPIARVDGPRHRLPSARTPKRLRVVGRALAALAAVSALAVTAAAWTGYRNLSGGITTSQALVGDHTSGGGEQNILIMGLDSRLDQHGQPLPQDIYDALHAGDETVGGYNSNVLILLHFPGGGGPVTAVSIPRDDYVDIPGCPSGVCKGKIKQAYGNAYQQAMDSMDSSTTEAVDREQKAREAGRKAEIATVRKMLGVPIDHFIEVTLGAFFQIARVVAPITVCLNEDTSDAFSGANFKKGVQQIDAAQAMAFVRQRRDDNDEMFTDMDRTRRQQAFIVSLVNALRSGGAMSDPSRMRNLLQVAQQNIAVDVGFDLAGFVDQASNLSGTSLNLYTLPISQFSQDAQGEDVNVVDVAGVRAIVHNLFTTGSPTTTQTPSAPTTLDVVNATTHDGLGAALEKSFAADGMVPGTVTTADSLSSDSSISYGTGAADAARKLADRLALTASASDTVAPGTVQLIVGSDFPASQYMSGDGLMTTSSTPATPVTTVDATATGTKAPAPTDLTEMSGAHTPCVK
jgi:LCP family protein required for cell wall assembly